MYSSCKWQMKKDKKYFMEKLGCRISRMKRDNTIEQLRGPKPTEDTIADYVSYGEMIPGSPKEGLSPHKSPSTPVTALARHFYCEDVTSCTWYKSHNPSSKSSFTDQTLWTTVSTPSLDNTEVSSSSLSEQKSSSPPLFHEDVNAASTEQEGEPKESTSSIASTLEGVYNTVSEQTHNINDTQTPQEGLEEQEFQNAICSECGNKRPMVGWKKDFTYAELYEATNGFSLKNFLSEGGFGCVYRGVLKDEMKVAVKQHKDASFQGEKEFKSEVDVLSKARHQNLVMLLGSCSEGSHRLLVYEYVCNGSLDQHLSRDIRIPLNWEKRVKIAMGAAKGLKFLHENNIIHRDMRPNNILVTHDHESLLGDFGLAKNHYDGLEESSENSLVGTLGYLAPEYAESGKASTRTDVYSFGVILLQLITGLRTTDKALEGKSLVEWAKPLLKEKNYPKLIDEQIADSHNVHELFWMVRLTEKCLKLEPSNRYPMAKVVQLFDYLIQGKTTCIEDFSPTHSDSVDSEAGSTPVEDNVETSFSKHPLISSNKTRGSARVNSDAFKHNLQKKVMPLRKGEGVLYDEMIV